MLKLKVPKDGYLRVGNAMLYFGKSVRVAVDAPKDIEVQRGHCDRYLRTCYGPIPERKV